MIQLQIKHALLAMMVVIALVFTSCIPSGVIRIGSPGEAKDIITVCSTTFNGEVADYSSRGPTYEGYTKPDLCAPGSEIPSARAKGTDMGRDLSREGEHYTKASGTSMATPAVAGSAALLIQAYQQQYGKKPSPEYIKAALLAGAAKESLGGQEYNPVHQGSGVVNLVSSLAKVRLPQVLLETTPSRWMVGRVTTSAARQNPLAEPMFSYGLFPGDLSFQKFIIIPGQPLPNLEIKSTTPWVTFDKATLGDVSKQGEFIAFLKVPQNAESGVRTEFMQILSSSQVIQQIPVTIQVIRKIDLVSGELNLPLIGSPSTSYYTFEVPQGAKQLNLTAETLSSCVDAYLYDSRDVLLDFGDSAVEGADVIVLTNPNPGKYTLALSSLPFDHKNNENIKNNCFPETIDVNLKLFVSGVESEPLSIHEVRAPMSLVELTGKIKNVGTRIDSPAMRSYCGETIQGTAINQDYQLTERNDYYVTDTAFSVSGNAAKLRGKVTLSVERPLWVDLRLPNGDWKRYENYDATLQCDGPTPVFHDIEFSIDKPLEGEYEIVIQEMIMESTAPLCPGGPTLIEPIPAEATLSVIQYDKISCSLVNLEIANTPLLFGETRGWQANITTPLLSTLLGELYWSDPFKYSTPFKIIPRVSVENTPNRVLGISEWSNSWFNVPSNAKESTVSIFTGVPSQIEALLSPQMVAEDSLPRYYGAESSLSLPSDFLSLSTIRVSGKIEDKVLSSNGEIVIAGEVYTVGDLSTEGAYAYGYFSPVNGPLVDRLLFLIPLNQDKLPTLILYSEQNHDFTNNPSRNLGDTVAGIPHPYAADKLNWLYILQLPEYDELLSGSGNVYLGIEGIYPKEPSYSYRYFQYGLTHLLTDDDTTFLSIDQNSDGDFDDAFEGPYFPGDILPIDSSYFLMKDQGILEKLATSKTIQVPLAPVEWKLSLKAKRNQFVGAARELRSGESIGGIERTGKIVIRDLNPVWNAFSSSPKWVKITLKDESQTIFFSTIVELNYIASINVPSMEEGEEYTVFIEEVIVVNEPSPTPARAPQSEPTDTPAPVSTLLVYYSPIYDQLPISIDVDHETHPLLPDLNIETNDEEGIKANLTLLNEGTSALPYSCVTSVKDTFNHRRIENTYIGFLSSTARFVPNYNSLGLGVGKYTAIANCTVPSLSLVEWMVGTPTNPLDLNEKFVDVLPVVTHSQFSLLEPRTVTNEKGVSNVIQTLSLPTGFVSTQGISYAEGETMLSHQLKFIPAFSSDVTDENGAADSSGTYFLDFEDEDIKLFDNSYTIIAARRTTGNGLNLTLMGEGVDSLILEQEIQELTYNGKVYQIANVIVSDSGTTQLKINGVLTRILGEGQIETLPDGTVLGIKDILRNEAGDVVRFTLGTEKLFLQDTDVTNSIANSPIVNINDIPINTVEVIIKGTNQNTLFQISDIIFKVKSDANLIVPKTQSLTNAVNADTKLFLTTMGIDLENRDLMGTQPKVYLKSLDETPEFSVTDVVPFTISVPTLDLTFDFTPDSTLVVQNSRVGYRIVSSSTKSLSGTVKISTRGGEVLKTHSVIIPFDLTDAFEAKIPLGVKDLIADLEVNFNSQNYKLSASRQITVADSLRDSDADTIIDFLDPDDDNDGLLDFRDRLVGNAASIRSNIPTLAVAIGSLDAPSDALSTSTNVEVHGNKTFEFKDGTKVLTRFNHDFDASSLDLTTVRFDKQASGQKGYALVQGLPTKDKELFIDNLTTITTVCIKDSEVTSINEVTAYCNGNAETLVACNNQLQNGFTCSYLESQNRYRITGLHHSAVIQQEFLSPPSTTTTQPSAERPYTIDRAAGGNCQAQWNCTEWAPCITGNQTRTCTNLNNCYKSRPALIQSCATSQIVNTTIANNTNVLIPGPPEQIEELPSESEQLEEGENQASSQSFYLYIGAGVLVLLLIIGALLIGKMGGGENTSQLKTYVEEARKQGYSDDYIQSALEEKGYSHSQINKLFK